MIYDTLDPDVAKYLRENRPPPGVRWHQNLTENYGVRQLVSRCFEVVGRILTPWKSPEDRPKGWDPDIDDGVKVNLEPLQKAGVLRIGKVV